MTKCEECGEPLKRGERIVIALDRKRRVWHAACLDASTKSIKDWPRSKPTMKIKSSTN